MLSKRLKRSESDALVSICINLIRFEDIFSLNEEHAIRSTVCLVTFTLLKMAIGTVHHIPRPLLTG